MDYNHLEKMVQALMYEGYSLYPYRPSAMKNQYRFNFGVISPIPPIADKLGLKQPVMQTECLVVGNQQTTIDVQIRFLHLLAQEVSKVTSPTKVEKENTLPELVVVQSLELDNQIFQTSQKTIECKTAAPTFNLKDLVAQQHQIAFTFPAKQETEKLINSNALLIGVITQKQAAIKGVIELSAELLTEQLYKVRASIFNLTQIETAQEKSRDELLMHSLISVHTILSVQLGEFISLLDTPEIFRTAADSCSNIGTWPILVGENGEKDLMLSSPIILYDYPKIAPESAADLYDSTEIQEILTLQILTLTDQEKHEIRFADKYISKILEKVEALSIEQLKPLHSEVHKSNILEKQK